MILKIKNWCEEIIVVIILSIIIEGLRQYVFEKCSQTKLAEKLINKVKKVLKKYKLSINY